MMMNDELEGTLKELAGTKFKTASKHLKREKPRKAPHKVIRVQTLPEYN
jgi:hypothetical protein